MSPASPSVRDPEAERLGASLSALLLQKDAAGSPIYSDDDLAAFIPFLVFQHADEMDPAALAAPVRHLIADLLDAAGVAAEDSDDAIREKVRGYYDAHPLNPDLLAEYERFARETAAEGADMGDRQALNKLLGHDSPQFSPSSEPAEGATSASELLARIPRRL